MAAAELAKGQALLWDAQILGVHDLVGGAIVEHSMLMDAALMLEGVGAHHGLVGGGLHAAEAGNGAADPVDAVSVHGGVAVIVFPAGAQPHDDFLHGSVAGALTQAVDGAFHLPRPAAHPLQGGGHRQPQVVVAVNGQGDRVGPGHLLQHIAEKLAVFLHGGVAHGVGQVDGGGAGADHALHHPVEKVPLGAGGILQGKLHVVAQLAGQAGGAHGSLVHILRGHMQLVGHMDGAGGDKHMDAPARSLLKGLAGGFDVGGDAAGEGTHRSAAQLPGDGGNGLEVAPGGGGKAGFDHIHAHGLQGPGDFHLFRAVEGYAGGLFAVAQGCVEDDDPFRCHGAASFCRKRPRIARQSRGFACAFGVMRG